MKRQKGKLAFGTLPHKIILALGSVLLASVVAWYLLQPHRQEVRNTLQSMVRKPLDYGEIVRFDPRREGGHLQPNLNVLMQGEQFGQRVRLITNSKGFRNDREFTYDVPPETCRILLVGDSYVDGMRTDQTKTIGYVLEQQLNDRDVAIPYRRYEVMISGHNNPANAWYHYQEHGQRYHPHVVILGVTLGNDLTWHSYKADMIPERDEKGQVLLTWSGRPRQAARALPKLMLPADAYCSDEELRKRRDASRETPMVGDGELPTPRESVKRRVAAADFHVSLGLFYQPTMPEIEEMYGDFEEVVVNFNQCLERHGSKLIVVLFPTRMQVYDSEWYRLTQRYALDEEAFDLTNPNRRLERLCQENKIAYLDLLPLFRQYAKTHRAPLYRPLGDMHFNELGQELAATALLPAVVSEVVD